MMLLRFGKTSIPVQRLMLVYVTFSVSLCDVWGGKGGKDRRYTRARSFLLRHRSSRSSRRFMTYNLALRTGRDSKIYDMNN